MPATLRILLAAAAAVVALVADAADAGACSCLPPPPPAEAFAGAGAVFTGTVEIIDDPSARRGDGKFSSASPVFVRFGVDLAFKGVHGAQAVVRTARSSASCGYSFDVGGRYLVYATAAAGGELGVSLCSRTRPVDRAAEDLAALEQLTGVGDGDEPADPAEPPTAEPAAPPATDPATAGDPPPPASSPPPPRSSRGCTCDASGGGTSGRWPWVVVTLLVNRSIFNGLARRRG